MKKVILNVPEEVASEFATELNALMQRYEVTQEYEPQDGDLVCFGLKEPVMVVGVYKSGNEKQATLYCAVEIRYKGKVVCVADEKTYNVEVAKYIGRATEENSNTFASAFAKEGKRWNEEVREFVRAEPYEVIRTVGDAIAATGIQMPESINGLADDIVAYLKLRIVVAAINGLKADTLNEWPRYTADEWRYWPWFRLLDEEVVAELTPEEKRRVVGRASNSANANGGCVCAYANVGSANSSTSYGGRLSFKSREAARYCAIQFAELWADFYGIKIVK